jgi:transcriptional regulator with XRE-family HTH domain
VTPAGAGRPELPVDDTIPACAELATFLRARRAATGLTYRQMAERTSGGPSAATLERAASGTTVPSLMTVLAFVSATVTEKQDDLVGEANRSTNHAEELWIRARRATNAPYYVHTAPDPDLIANKADFLRALRDQHAWAGAPSPREIERGAGPGVLPSTTARRIIQGRALPVTPAQALAFLIASNVIKADDLQRWLKAAARLPLKHPKLWADALDRYESQAQWWERLKTSNSPPSTKKLKSILLLEKVAC